MNILLIDVDSKIPNLALMKLSTYWKSVGATVNLLKLGFSGYPKKNSKPKTVDVSEYDAVFSSCVFTTNEPLVNIVSKNSTTILKGGTGYNVQAKLPEHIDALDEDYSIYPDNNTSYGFITRGCVRHCDFCFVFPKEGQLSFYRHPSKIIKHKRTEFLDNNFLAYDKKEEILEYLIDKHHKITFCQGLDFRYLTPPLSESLAKLNYDGEYIFAFDNISYEAQLQEKLNIFQQAVPNPWRIKLFILVGYNSTIKQDLYRINWCLKRKILPYVMRFQTCYNCENTDFYTDLAAFANQPALIKKMSFEEYIYKRHANKKRADYSWAVYRANEL